MSFLAGGNDGPKVTATPGHGASAKTEHDVKQQKRRRAAGFSLIEFTAVLALMALLAGIVTVNVRHFMTKGKQNAARVELATIRDAIENFHSTEGHYPTNEEGLTVLSKSTGVNGANDGEAILRQTPIDPWNHAYQYNTPGRSEPYEVICLGADGREGGAGADADISTEDLKDRGAK